MLKKVLVLSFLLFAFIAVVSCKEDLEEEEDAAIEGEAAGGLDLGGAIETVGKTLGGGGKKGAAAGADKGFISKLVAFVQDQCDALLAFINGGGESAANSTGAAAAGEKAAKDGKKKKAIKGEAKAVVEDEDDEAAEEEEPEE